MYSKSFQRISKAFSKLQAALLKYLKQTLIFFSMGMLNTDLYEGASCHLKQAAIRL